MKIKCISKNRNNKGVIINYTLQEETGRQFQATAQQIKAEILKGQYKFTNLQIDKAGRLVDKAEEKGKALVTKSEKTEQKKSSRDIVKEFLLHLNKIYTDNVVSISEQFINDYTGRGNVTWDENLKRGCIKVNMPAEAKKFFRNLVRDIEKQAAETKSEIFVQSEEAQIETADLPETVIKFYQKTKCNYEIIQALFKLASENKKLASIRVEDTFNCEGWSSSKQILTSNYKYAKQYIDDSINEFAYGKEVVKKDAIEKGIIGIEGNDLGKVYFLRYISEFDGKDLKHYKQRLIDMVTQCLEEFPNENKVNIVKNVLNDIYGERYGTPCGTTYMVLKYGVFNQGEDDKEYAKLLNKEAEELLKR